MSQVDAQAVIDELTRMLAERTLEVAVLRAQLAGAGAQSEDPALASESPDQG